jgi:sulfur carrier protein ThiS
MAMIRVTIGSTTESKSIIVPDTSTVEQLFKDNNIVTANCSVSLNSNPVKDLSKTLAQLGATEDSYLFAVFNSKNA